LIDTEKHASQNAPLYVGAYAQNVSLIYEYTIYTVITMIVL